MNFKNFKIIEETKLDEVKEIEIFTSEEEAEVEANNCGFNFYRDYDIGAFYIEKQ